ncbi:unnamed protein product [Symbiodinium natans]|uniref:Uncharacterized protein n=1 Tax=Symbiodinium natans TaxID=878477 RepID=A0A812S4I4_9DINO|nr:unnamed protein product [Symbiodinium natans]
MDIKHEKLRATASAASQCPDCVSRSWRCPKRCNPSDTKLHRFDFQYSEKRCAEVVPWNGSSMQVDMDLWCAMPATRRCRDFWCRQKRVGCDNMNRYTFRGLLSSTGSCPVPPEHEDLMVQNCHWVCKRGAPFMRCKYDFDHYGKHGIQSRLDTCWIQERCEQGQAQSITTTCKPAARAVEPPHASVLGFATLLVADLAPFMAQPGLDRALGGALAKLVAVAESQVAVEIRGNISRQRDMLGNATQALHASFNISVFGNASASPLQRAVATKVLMEQANSSEISGVMNRMLSARGLEASVQAADLTVSPGLHNTTAQSPSGQEFYALVSLLRKYKDYLDEVHTDLQEAQSEMSLQNLSREDFTTIQAKHTSARQHLSQIMSSHAELSSEIETAIAQRNLSKHALAMAQSAAQSAAAELLRMQANLSSSQADLAALKQKQVEAEQSLLNALAAKEGLNKQLKANATRLGTSLEAVYEDLKYMRQLLVETRQANQSIHEELRSLEEDFLEEQANHNVTKFVLALERQDHNLTMEELEKAEEDRARTQWRLQSEKQQHIETKQGLHDEQVLHLQTKAQLREASKAASTMTLTFILVTSCMSLLVVALAAAFLVTLLRKRSVERIPVLAPNAGGENNIVVGLRFLKLRASPTLRPHRLQPRSHQCEGRPVQPPPATDAWVKTALACRDRHKGRAYFAYKCVQLGWMLGEDKTPLGDVFQKSSERLLRTLHLHLLLVSQTCAGHKCVAAGPRALAALPPGPTGTARLVVAAARGAEWWEEVPGGSWTRLQEAADPGLGRPFFSVAVEPSTGLVAVGGGAGRAASLFAPNGSLLATLGGHTGWVRDLLFQDGQLFSIGCNFIKVWRRHGDAHSSWRHLGDLEVRGDLLALSVCGGFLVASGASRRHHWFRLSSSKLRPKEWLAEAQASLTETDSPHIGRTTCLACRGSRLFSCGHDGRVCIRQADGNAQCSDELPGGKLLSMALLDGGKVAVGTEEGQVHVLDAESLRALASIQPFPGSPINALAQVPEERIAAASSAVAGFAVASLTRGMEFSRTGKRGIRSVALHLQGRIRSPTDPGVRSLRERLQTENCMAELPVFSPSSADFNASYVSEIFRINGFVVLEDALSDLQLQELHEACDDIMDQVFQADPEGSFGGGAGKLPHRYSLGDSSRTKSNFHLEAFASLVDLETTTPLLMAIFGSREYLAAGCGGDVALAGAIEYQALHPDAIWGVLEKPVADYDVPPAVTINFVLENLTAINGPMRVVPGSHRWRHRPPTLHEEPDWMMFNTLCPIRAGAAIFRDNRLWHGGTPNLSSKMRALPNMEYFPPGAMPSLGWLDRHTMPWHIWQRLSPLGQYLSRYTVAPPDESIPGINEYTPGAILEIMPFLR